MADRHLHGRSAAKALAEEVGPRNVEIFQKSRDIVGVIAAVAQQGSVGIRRVADDQRNTAIGACL